MADIEHLKDLVAKLSARIHTLEAKAGLGPSVQVPESVRMVLIGPPGAGK